MTPHQRRLSRSDIDLSGNGNPLEHTVSAEDCFDLGKTAPHGVSIRFSVDCRGKSKGGAEESVEPSLLNG
ncbi:hypothetical protein BGLA2_1380033 [Burkholderia gladioli]|nr:hypothetical protein BGLA2_1380033 [Burkholderia gladioli]